MIRTAQFNRPTHPRAAQLGMVLLVLLQLRLLASPASGALATSPAGDAVADPQRHHHAHLHGHAALGQAILAAGTQPSALSFDGVNDQVRVNDSASLRITTTLTIEAWIMPVSVSGHQHIAGKNNYEISIEPSGSGFAALFEFSSRGAWRSVASGQLALNQWHHIAGTYDGSNMRLFVNGARVASIQTSGSIDQTANPFRIGSADGSGDFFPGQIDEARVSNVVRYTGNFVPPQSPFVPDAGTKGLWHLDEGAGTTTADASGNGNTGTLVNGSTWTTASPFTGPDTTPPAVSAVNVGNLSTTGATITWTTDEPATSQVEYGATTGYGLTTTLDAALVTAHSQPLTGLVAATTYHYRVISKDNAGNQTASADGAFTTLTANPPAPPVISGMTSGGITASSATIVWTTDVPADSQVEYGPTTSYGASTMLDTALVTGHSQTLSGLNANTTYHYRVKSRGENGALATSGDGVFVTGGSAAGTLGQWSPAQNWPLVAIHMAQLPNGEVLTWDGWELQPNVYARVWNPTSQTFTGVTNQFSSIFCAGQSALADGRILVTGGFISDGAGIKDANIFNPATNSWTRVADMQYARWYPTNVTLGDGRVLVLGGTISPGVYADIPEIYNPTTNTWTALPGARLNVGEYPVVFLMPNGKVFLVAGPDGQSRMLDIATQTWTILGAAPVATGTGVMYRAGKILATGGGTNNANPVQAGAAVIDLNQPTPAWRPVAPMAYPRFQHNLVTLPDGKVLAIGGATEYSLVSTSGVLPAELWDPATETWTTVASLEQPRMYHSTGMLLPDGRVVAAGGGRVAPAADYASAQTYSPPYLFRGARPTITSAPGTTNYGATMTVQTPEAADITAVAFIRLSSVTHAVDMDQRYIDLSFTTAAGSLTVQAPNSADLAPPGYYLLFVINAAGVPSAATIVQLGGAPADSQAPTVALTAPTSGATLSGTVTVAASATDNVGVAGVQFLLDGQPLGAADTTAPYSVAWDTTTATNGTHALTARVSDAAGNAGLSAAVTITVANPVADTTPPVISAVSATGAQSSAATIGWTTNEPATSQVEYGATTAYGSLTAVDGTLVTGHSLTLSGLAADTTYHYRVISRDAAGNVATSDDFSLATAAAGPVTLLGQRAIEGQIDYNAPGMAEAFQYTADASGSVTKLYVYIDESSTATSVVVGLYTNTRDDNPGTLLTQATLTNPINGAWNAVTVPAAGVTAGGQYWIAVLGPVGAGTVRFRDAPSGSKAQTSAQGSLSILPSVWSAGANYYNAPMSAYAVQEP